MHEALQRIFTEGSLRRDEMEDKILTALRALSETDALRALDQFGNEDMTRIRNKAAYLGGSYGICERAAANRSSATRAHLARKTMQAPFQ